MSHFVKALNTAVTDAEWKRAAETAGVSVEELKKKIIPALEAEAGQPGLLSVPERPQLELGDVKVENDCQTQSFEVSLFKIIGVSGDLKLCGTSSSNWTAELKVCLVVAGSKVWCTSYKFSPSNLGICYSPSVGFAKADLCFKLVIGSGKVCFNINGKACVWALGWKCGDFDVTPFCIPLP